jgi:hypothetical protein
MDADLDLLLIAVYCTADDLLPNKAKNTRRIVTEAKVVTLCIAQAIMGIASDPRFLAVAAKRLRHLFPLLPQREEYYKRREALSDTVEALIDEFARHSLGYDDTVLLVDSTPIECARSRETVKPGGCSSLADVLTDAADSGIGARRAARILCIGLAVTVVVNAIRARLERQCQNWDNGVEVVEEIPCCEQRNDRAESGSTSH